MKPVRNIFLHFFDLHYLREKGAEKWKSTIFREASIATRIALLGAYNIIIPASSYFESPLCKNIIDSYSDLHHLGLFKLVGNSYNLQEFILHKITQYKFNKSTLQIYEDHVTCDINIPFSKRHRSSTLDISKQWQDLLLSKDIKPLFLNTYGINIPKNIEQLWHEAPVKLAGKPFIVENVFPILFPNQDQELSATNTLHSHINQYYFSSYTKEFKAGIVSDLVYLEPNYKISVYDLCLPYKYILRELNSKNKFHKIIDASSDELIQIGESDEWAEILRSSLEKKKLHDSQFTSLWGKKENPITDRQSKSSQETKIFIQGDYLQMGDKYNGGQVGAQGPNAHAHDMNFNQIWNQNESGIDLNQLSEQLADLRTKLSETAFSPEHYAEIGHIANAEIEAKSGNGSKVMEYLSKAGKWSFDTATALGVAVAANAIKLSTGS